MDTPRETLNKDAWTKVASGKRPYTSPTPSPTADSSPKHPNAGPSTSQQRPPPTTAVPVPATNRLNIIQINVNSIITNERRVSLLDCIKTYKPDILLLSETKLNPRHRIDFQNYRVIRTDRPNAKQAGGTAIIIKDNITCKHITINNTTCFEATVIELKLQNTEKLFIIAGYATSSCKKEFMVELKHLFQQLELHNHNNYYILAGDLNAKHHACDNAINNNRGIALNKWIQENEIPYRISLYKTATPSFPKSGAFIDLCIADSRIKFHNTPKHRSLNSFPYDSDHRAVKIQISIPTMKTLEIDETVAPKKYNFNKTDWTQFKNFLIETDDTILPNNRNLTTDEIDEYIDKLSDNINKAIDHATPQIPKNQNATDNAYTKPTHGQTTLTNIIKQKTDALKQEILLQDKLHNKTICTFDNTNTADNPDEDRIPPDYFSSHTKLKLILKKLNNKKLSSFDNIPNIVLKNLPLHYTYNYTIIFNNCLNLTYFPTAWKTAKLIAIKKKGKDGSNPVDYRPISLLANISKVFEASINNAISKHCDKNNVIPEMQFGFRHKHSTTHAISKLMSDICWARNADECVGALFIDLQKAFDTVWWEGLFFELIKKGFPQHLTKMIWSMLHGKKFRVAEKSYASTETFHIKNGLQQGTVNSPIFFSIFISDLFNMYGLNNDHDKFAIAFADDLLVYIKDSKPSKIKIQLQDILNKIQDYLHTWKLKINTDKCETILFRPYISKISNANTDVRKHTKNFHLQDTHNAQTKLQNKNIVRYLGVHIDYRLNYYNHVDIQIDKAQKAFASHKRLFYSKELNTETKITCYKSLIRPILTYASPIWFNVSASTMEKLRVIERKCLRACLGKYRTPESNYTKLISNHKLYEYANITRIDLHILKLIRNHWANIRNVTNNSLIYSSTYPNPQYHEKTRHTGYIPPEAFTHLDSQGYIQDKDNTPLIYHTTRKADNKKILYSTDINDNDTNTRLNYNSQK
ncbi:PREDICTED: uncharacterized protein LOC108578067 [Habropoda laboriosa]|uniref:uncharacterized protein LOC108578067 n=1 Tax=Habropoda laboriosa TaxID=597456 RepID=UPI00083E529F|nr:PREDICTED: uncharacterized protein LOC108578067 [Habropoda laboriosa]